MATVIIKSANSDNQALVDDTGHLLVTAAGGGGLSNVNIFDSFGNPLNSTSGALNVDINGVNPNQNSVLIFNKVNAVSIGMETTIATYTAPSGKTSCLLLVSVSGENVGQWTIYNNLSIYDQNYTSSAQLNEVFNFATGSSIVPGQIIGVGNTITVTVNQIGNSSANFSARIQVLEIG